MLTGPRAAVLGSPIRHSLSPVLHRAAYEALGLTDWGFEVHELDAAALPPFLASLHDSWRGLALTMPLKEAALALADTSSRTARRTAAANTLVRKGDLWHAENTDVWGVREALVAAGIEPVADGDVAEGVAAEGVVVLLGSGATARSALAAVAGLGFRDVVFAVRGQVRPETLLQAREHGMTVSSVPLTQAAAIVADATVVVSTLPPGGADDVATDLGTDLTQGPSGGRLKPGVLLDVVYAGWPTPLARAAQQAGMTVVPGIEMLIHQAAEQVRLITGLPAPLAAMQAVGRAAQAAAATS